MRADSECDRCLGPLPNRRSMRRISGKLGDGKSTRPSVCEMVVELLMRHRAELDEME